MDGHGSNWPKERRQNVSGFVSISSRIQKYSNSHCAFHCVLHSQTFICHPSLSPSNGEGIWQSLSGGPVAGGPVPELRGGGGGTPR